MKLHARAQVVPRLALDVSTLILERMERDGVTYTEALAAMAQAMTTTAKYAIRVERHGNTSERGDEAARPWEIQP